MMGKILIVDDNEINLKLFEAILKKVGYDYVIAKNGIEAVEVAVKEKPSLVLMDIQMPTMDGEKAFHFIREKEETADIPIVAITSYALNEDRKRLIAAGFDGYLSKPISVEDFLNEIRKFCR